MKLHPPTIKYQTAIFIIAFATIAVQILLTRIFSVTLYYHYAFVTITMVMLGLTGGALKVYTRPDKFNAKSADQVLAVYASYFASNLILAVFLHMLLPGILLQWVPSRFHFEDTAFANASVLMTCLVVSTALLFVAFIQSGVCIALLLTRFPSHTNRLYAWDLGGAALGCIAIVAALMVIDPIGLMLVITTAVSIMAFWLLPTSASHFEKKRIKITTIIIMSLCLLQVTTYLHGTPAFRLLWAKDTAIADDPPDFERWNTYSRVSISPTYTKTPIGWGYGLEPDVMIPQKSVTIDSGASTIITAFDGDIGKIEYLKDDVINLGYHVRYMDNVAVIGVGGGRDILSGLVFGAHHIKGIEINPAILGALTNTYGDFSGHLDKRPGVSFALSEARSYLNSHDDTYDLIQISLIDTWAATVAGGLTLSENTLYTTDAWSDFFNRLNDKGILEVSRWYDTYFPAQYYRLLSIASSVLKSRYPNENPRDHILAAKGGYTQKDGPIATVIISKSPLTHEDIVRFNVACRSLNFTPLLTPYFAEDKIATTIASGNTDKAFFKNLSQDVTAPSDDKPFFFNSPRMRYVFNDSITSSYRYNKVNFTLAAIFLVTIITALFCIVWPMQRLYWGQRIRVRETLPYMLYFACIGLGFMLIEISQMQRLIIFLGHPVYGLTVVLFTLLISSSLGSYLQQYLKTNNSNWWLAPALLCAILVVMGIGTPHVIEHLKYYDTTIRIIVSCLLIMPMGIVMGMMFPLGVAISSRRYVDLLPWYWGVNGAASVFSSVLAVVLSLQSGISSTFWAGTACYSVCLLVALRQRKITDG